MRSFSLDDGRKATVAAGVTVFFWASAFVAIRAAGRQYDPGALALGRLGVATLVLLPVLAIRREGLPARKAWPGIVASGLLWFGLYMVTLNQGERLVDAGTAAMLVNVAPILAVLLAGWLLKEGVTRNVLLGLAVAFPGTILVGLATGGFQSTTSWSGVWLCLLAALCYALGMVLQKPALRHASSLQVTTFSCLVGTLACLPFSGQLWAQASRAPLAATANIVYLGLFPTALGFLTWGYALSRTNTAKLAATTYVVPFLVILLSWALLGEVPSALAVLGGVLCLSGVALARSRRAQPPVSSPMQECSGSTRYISEPVD